MANEVEGKLVPPSREDALASFMFRIFSEHIEWQKGSLPEFYREVRRIAKLSKKERRTQGQMLQP